MSSPNGLVCFTNCLLPQEDGNLVHKDLWIDERSGKILDAHRTFYNDKMRPGRVIDLGGNILSPGLLDIQINGGYGFDFSVYEGDEAYMQGMQRMAGRIVETGVTSLLPTIITQEKSLYPKLLPLLKPFSSATSATLLGWHAEGPFIDYSKRGAHAPPLLLAAPGGYGTFEQVYGAENLADKREWFAQKAFGVRMITAAPEIPGVMDALQVLAGRGIIMSIGHSNASTGVATSAVTHGARLITHLFNAMPPFHHRDPSIVGLLGASPHLNYPDPAYLATVPCELAQEASPTVEGNTNSAPSLESPGTLIPIRERVLMPSHQKSSDSEQGNCASLDRNRFKGGPADTTFKRPFYGIIVDGIHCHPNSVRLAHAAHPNGCILITDAMKILDPNLEDGVYDWRDGGRFVKEGEKLYLEGTTTLAGRCLGIEGRKGTLRPGADADLVVLDRAGNVVSTWVAGKEIWTRDQAIKPKVEF